MIDSPNQTSFLMARLSVSLRDHELVELRDVLVLDVDHLLQLVDVDFLDVLPRATASRPASGR